MKKFIIRNDDVSSDTSLLEIKTFCEICDNYGFKILQAITLIGECKKVDVKMSNDTIKNLSKKVFEDNKEVLEYLQKRKDLIGVHGLWHTHKPLKGEIKISKNKLNSLGFSPTYFIPPFNEGNYRDKVIGLKVNQLYLKKGERLEDFLEKGIPSSDIMYLHSWRFNNSWYTFNQLDKCLNRLSKKYDKTL